MFKAKRNNTLKVVVLFVCSAGFATYWRLSSWREATGTINVEIKNEELEMKTCSCDRCITENNTFFMLHYNTSVNPFLTLDGNLTQEDFNWWKALQFEIDNLTKFNAVKERLFKVFPSQPHVTESHPDLCRTCAIVGNSGNLRQSSYGRQIDAHGVVIRMNKGKTSGYEVDVGTRTTHRVMYPESGVDVDNSTHLVLFPFKILDLQWIVDAVTTGFHGRSYAPVKTKIKVNNSLVMVVNPGFMKYVHSSWLLKKGRYPSTGFMTLILALHICDQGKVHLGISVCEEHPLTLNVVKTKEKIFDPKRLLPHDPVITRGEQVSVFGFGADKNGDWNHYWEELQVKNLKTGVHPGKDEYNLIQELAKQNIVTFYRGW